MELSQTTAVRECLDPILESPANRFLFSKLGCNVPIGYSFPTITNYGLPIRTGTFGRIIDNRVIRYRFLAMWTYDLVFHLLFLLRDLEFFSNVSILGVWIIRLALQFSSS